MLDSGNSSRGDGEWATVADIWGSLVESTRTEAVATTARAVTSAEDGHQDWFDPHMSPGFRGLLTAIQVTLCILGVAGNLGIFILVLRDRTLRVWGNYLHLSLAGLHLAGCLLLAPLHLATVHRGLAQGSLAARVGCRLLHTGLMAFSVGNCVLLSQIALCRWYILVSGEAHMGRPHWTGSLWPTWALIAVLMLGSFLLRPARTTKFRVMVEGCISRENFFPWQIQGQWVMWVVCALVMVCVVVLITSYVKILQWMRRTRAVAPQIWVTFKGGNENDENISVGQLEIEVPKRSGDNPQASPLQVMYRKAIKKNLLVLFFFVLSFTPAFIVIVVGKTRAMQQDVTLRVAMEVSWTCFYVITVASPVIFVLGRDVWSPRKSQTQS